MAVSTSQLKQVVSARVTGVGATSTHVIGGTNTITDDVDIAFGFTMKCGHASNSVELNYNDSGASNKPTLEHTTGVGTDAVNALICDQEIAANSVIQDATFTDIPTIVKIVAIYFEAPAANGVGGVTITGTPGNVGTFELGAGSSVLITPKFTNTTSTKHVLELETVNDILKVIVLGNSS